MQKVDNKANWRFITLQLNSHDCQQCQVSNKYARVQIQVLSLPPREFDRMSATTNGRNSASDPDGNVIKLALLLPLKPNTDDSRWRMLLHAADITAVTDWLTDGSLQPKPSRSEYSCNNWLNSSSRNLVASANPCVDEWKSRHDKQTP